MTVWDVQQYYVFVSIWTFQLGLLLKSRVLSYSLLLRFLCLIHSFYRSYVSCVYILHTISPTYPIYPIYWFTISRYGALFHPMVRYFSLFQSISVYFALFCQSLVPQKGPHGIHIRYDKEYTKQYTQKYTKSYTKSGNTFAIY